MKTEFNRRFDELGYRLSEDLTDTRTEVVVRVLEARHDMDCHRILQLFVEIASSMDMPYEDDLENRVLYYGDTIRPRRRVLIVVGYPDEISYDGFDSVIVFSKTPVPNITKDSEGIVNMAYSEAWPGSYLISVTNGHLERHCVFDSTELSYYSLVRAMLEATDIIADILNIPYVNA